MQLIDAIRAELTKLTWRSGVLWAAIPLSIIVPLVLTAGIAALNEAIWDKNAAATPDEVLLPGGYSMTPDNAVYWVLFFSTFFMMCAAVNSYGSEVRSKTVVLFNYIQPRRWTLLTAKLVVFGGLGAATTAVAVLAINGIVPRFSPRTWSEVSLFTPAGIRFVWAIPLYTVLLVALGLGLVALVRQTYIVVAAVLFLKLGTEAALLLASVDFGNALRRYSPFINAEYSTGQMQGMPDGIWGRNVAIAFYATCFLTVFGIGLWRSARVDRT
ncbi:hypothetical protein ACWIGI_15900 [Nocardia sp. NPDC055321]